VIDTTRVVPYNAMRGKGDPMYPSKSGEGSRNVQKTSEGFPRLPSGHRVPWKSLIGVISVGLAYLCWSAGTLNATKLNNKYCKQNPCNEQANESSPDCSASLCTFQESGGNVIWCAYREGAECELVTPVKAESCTGRCTVDPERACSVSWSKCELP
jgi:hypothetical protein